MEPPDFRQMAEDIADGLSNLHSEPGATIDGEAVSDVVALLRHEVVPAFAAALRKVHTDALESAARVAEERKPTNPRDDWTEYAMIVNAEVEKTAAAIRALATKEDGK